MPITVGAEKSIADVKHAVHAGTPLGIVLQKNPLTGDPGRDALCHIGPAILPPAPCG